MGAIEALFGDLLLGLTQSSAFRWGAAAIVVAWIWLVGRSNSPWRVASLLAPLLVAAMIEFLDRLVIGPGAGAQNGWLPFYLHSTGAFGRLISLDGAVMMLLALIFGFLNRFAVCLLLSVLTAMYLRYALFGAGEVLLSWPVLTWVLTILPTVLLVHLALYSLGATIRLILDVRQDRGVSDYRSPRGDRDDDWR